MARKFRRVVTGNDADGKAICVSDEEATAILQRPARPGVTMTNLWRTTTTPAEFDGPEETVGGPFLLHPPENGSVFRVIEFEPEDQEVLATLDGKAAFSDMGAAHAIVEDARHPFMHRTDSVDYAIILKGEIDMLLDDSEVHLKEGDMLVQRGTNHAWSNRGTESCFVAFVLIDGIAKAEDSSS